MKRLLLLLLFIILCQFALYSQTAGEGFSFDIGTEPEPTSNVSYGIVQYGWSDITSSRLDVRYTNSSELQCATATENKVRNKIEGYDTAIYSAKSQIFEADFLPYIRYFGKNENGREFSWSIGASIQYTMENEFAGMFDVNGLMLDPGDEGKYFTMNDDKTAIFVAPRIGFSAKIPLTNLFCLNAECFAHPLYLMVLKQNMAYHSDQTTSAFDYSGNNNLNSFSSPYISLKLTLDMFNNFRLITFCNYQHLVFQQLDWADDFNSLVGYDDIQDLFSFRGGLELLSGDSKSARLRFGVYYQIDVNKSSYLKTTDNKNRFILSLGTEL